MKQWHVDVQWKFQDGFWRAFHNGLEVHKATMCQQSDKKDIHIDGERGLAHFRVRKKIVHTVTLTETNPN